MTHQRADKLNAIVEALEGAGAAGLTRSEIADVLKLRKSPYLLELIRQVEDAGFAVSEMLQSAYPPRWIYYYRNPAKLTKES